MKRLGAVLLCWVYGDDPVRYTGLKSVLPASRCFRCPDEYVKQKKAWSGPPGPHLRT